MKVAVVQGGPSSEAEVSRASARAVARALTSAGHTSQCWELDENLPRALGDVRPDVVFPLVHGAQGEDGCLQGVLEVLGLPYVGSDVRASAICADKSAAKLFFSNAGLPLARDRKMGREALQREPAELLAELRKELGSAFMVKPMQGGSTLGMARILANHGADTFASALAQAHTHDEFILFEEYVVGQELTCAVLDTQEGSRALPPILVAAQATEWLDFQSKYQQGGCSHLCPAPLPDQDLQRVRRAALSAHLAVGARDLSRSDFLLTEDGRLVILELNTLPGMTERSLFPDAAAADGIAFTELVDLLVKNASARGPRKWRADAPPLP